MEKKSIVCELVSALQLTCLCGVCRDRNSGNVRGRSTFQCCTVAAVQTQTVAVLINKVWCCAIHKDCCTCSPINNDWCIRRSFCTKGLLQCRSSPGCNDPRGEQGLPVRVPSVDHHSHCLLRYSASPFFPARSSGRNRPAAVHKSGRCSLDRTRLSPSGNRGTINRTRL